MTPLPSRSPELASGAAPIPFEVGPGGATPANPTRRRTGGSGRHRGPIDPPGSAQELAPSKATEPRTNLISLARARLLLWATPRGEKVAFEVSKAVSSPLQARCKTAPLCPGEEAQSGLPGWVRPDDPPRGSCPYDYSSRGECICDRNVEALSAALFAPPEARLVGNYLNALGYTVREEPVPPETLDGTRILNAHAKIGDSHDVRVMSAPGVGELVLVRDLVTSP